MIILKTRRITTIKRLPWDDIEVPNLDLNRRLAMPNMVAPASWAVDRQGRRLFVIELSGDYRVKYEDNVVSVHGLEIDLRRADDDGHELLVMTLESDQNADLFAALCQSLLSELVDAKSSAMALDISLNHIRRWKAFLSNRNARLLKSEEIRGLFAELWFLLELGRTQLGPSGAVFAWYGPERVQHDFIFAGRAVEVKSLVSVDPLTIRISSENQLESSEPQLFLVVVLLSETNDGNGRSLNMIAEEAKSQVLGTEAGFQLETKLAEFGYMPLREYDRPLLSEVGVLSFAVTKGFPRIVRSALPVGVVRVAYQVQLEHIQAFGCELATALGSA
jgi:Putative  PD-(D/E)XK family member, (DUF4420)